MNVNRREALRTMAAGLAAPLMAQNNKTNLLILFADDMGWGELACYGHPTIRTPNLDQMARDGVRDLVASNERDPEDGPAPQAPELQRLLTARRQHEAWQHQQRMARLARCLIAQFAAVKQQHGWVDMNDVERTALVMLAGPAAKFITGSSFTIDDGQMLRS